MRIALISTDYPPLRTSAAVQIRDLAVELSNQGHEPVVIVACADLPKPWVEEMIDGVRVLRLNAPRTRETSYLRRTIAELLLPIVLLLQLRRSPYRVTPWDLIAWYSPPIFFGPLIWVMKRSARCAGYLILRDIFPEWALDLGLIRKGPAYWFFKAVAGIQYGVADVIGVQTPSNLPYLSDWASPRRRVEVLQNWQTPAPNIGCSIDVSKTALAGRTIFVYIGNMGVAQGMDILVELAASLAHRPDIGFLFVGRGSEVLRLAADASRRSLSNTLFFNEVDSAEMPGLLAQCHVGLLALDPRHKSHNIPGKFLTYLLVGVPVLARVNPGTDLANLIDREFVGRVYEGESASALQRLAEELADSPSMREEMAGNGRALGPRMFSSEAAARQLVSGAGERIEAS